MAAFKHLLHLNFSPRQNISSSYQLVQDACLTYFKHKPQDEVNIALEQQFLAKIALPDANFTAASLTLPAQRDKTDQAHLAYSEYWLQQIERSDALLLSMPLHNFSIPASCKAWLDWIMRPWRSFDFSAEGKYGLLQNKACAILISSGGSLHDGRQIDFASPYLHHALGTIGLQHPEFIYLENARRQQEQQVPQALAKLQHWLARVCKELEHDSN